MMGARVHLPDRLRVHLPDRLRVHLPDRLRVPPSRRNRRSPVRSADRCAAVRWWDAFPGRREREFQELTEAGVPFEVDAKAEARGVLRLAARPSVDGLEIPVFVTFPDHYPYFRFEVESSEISLGHHQNPFTGALCLIGRGTDQWHVSDTAAAFITSRLPKTLAAGTNDAPDEVAGQEQDQAEPFSDYYSYPDGTMLSIDGSWRLDARRGSFDAAVTGDAAGRIRGIVLRVRDEQGTVLVEAPPLIDRLFERTITGRWIRSDAAIVENDAHVLRDRLTDIDASLRKLRLVGVGSKRVDVLAVIYPEEVAWRETGDGWLFVVSVMRPRR